MTSSGDIQHPELGRIRCTVRRTARRFVARWKADGLHLTVPAGATAHDIIRALATMKLGLLARKPVDTLYEFDREMRFEDLSVTIKGITAFGSKCTLKQTAPTHFDIFLDSSTDLTAASAIETVGRMMKNIARYLAPAILLPRAAAIASQIGVEPSQWSISSGRKVLGRCNSRREIALSAILVFASRQLRDYVICHELAHLSEMNHSPRFHALCDKYCDGQSRRLEHDLKTFRFPIP